jgi:hypothetical protein
MRGAGWALRGEGGWVRAWRAARRDRSQPWRAQAVHVPTELGRTADGWVRMAAAWERQ